MAQLGDWLRGRTPKQRAGQARHLEHPTRSALLLGAMWGALFWVFAVRSLDPVRLVLVILASLWFGFAMMWWIRRDLRKRSEQT
jgi:hypothetical protein